MSGALGNLPLSETQGSGAALESGGWQDLLVPPARGDAILLGHQPLVTGAEAAGRGGQYTHQAWPSGWPPRLGWTLLLTSTWARVVSSG